MLLAVVKGNTLYMDGGVQTYAPDGFNYSTKFPGRNILGISKPHGLIGASTAANRVEKTIGLSQCQWT